MTNLPSFSAMKLSLVEEELPLVSFVSTVIFNFLVGLIGRCTLVPPGPSWVASALVASSGESSTNSILARSCLPLLGRPSSCKTRAPSGPHLLYKGRIRVSPNHLASKTVLYLSVKSFACSGDPAKMGSRQTKRWRSTFQLPPARMPLRLVKVQGMMLYRKELFYYCTTICYNPATKGLGSS